MVFFSPLNFDFLNTSQSPDQSNITSLLLGITNANSICGSFVFRPY